MRSTLWPVPLASAVLLSLASWTTGPVAAESTVPPPKVESFTREACEPIQGIGAVLGPGRVLLLGEVHGTAESPAFVAAVTCHALREGLSVTVALELPQDEEKEVRGFLGSPGSDEEVAKTLRLPFWRKDYQDGRTSLAMLELLHDLRAMKEADGMVRLILLDKPRDFRKRDQEMADRLLAAFRESPGDLFVALTGNMHNRTAPGSGRMGERVLAALGASRVTSLNLSHTGGSAWICEATAGCGPFRLRGRGEGPGRRIDLYAEPDARGFHGSFHVGSITASPPATQPPGDP